MFSSVKLPALKRCGFNVREVMIRSFLVSTRFHKELQSRQNSSFALAALNAQLFATSFTDRSQYRCRCEILRYIVGWQKSTANRKMDVAKVAVAKDKSSATNECLN